MTKTFTENDLLKYVYDEVNEDERLELSTAIEKDFNLKEKVSQLKSLTKTIDGFVLKAPSGAVERILYASRNLRVA